MRRYRKRDLGAVAVVVLVCGVVFASPALDRFAGVSLDILTALRWQAFGLRHDPASAPAVVVAIDEETFRTPPFAGSPSLTWTREIGRVLTAVVDGGAAVVGFDIVFPSSIEQSEIPFGEEPLGTRLRGFDRDFLRALASAAKSDKVVLGEVLHQDRPVRPAAGQRIAVGQQKNIRALNTHADPDDVVRRLPLWFSVGGRPLPSMALELAARALGTAPVREPDGTTVLAGWRVPSAVPGTQTLGFEGGADAVPTYSFADLRACAETGDADFFRRTFGGKVVLFGTLFDIEDRKVTSKRFATGVEAARGARCALPLPAAPAEPPPARSSIAGVYIHATAVNDLLRRTVPHELGRLGTTATALAAAGLAALGAMLLGPGLAVLAVLGLLAAWTAAGTVALQHGLVLPLVGPTLAALTATAGTIGWRLVAADREERFLRRSFALYLSPQVIDRMLEADEPPALGGEMRDVTVFFSDIAGFSSIAETMTPAALVAWMNAYLSEMTDIVEGCGGYVDKYIGDSIVAVFGAPANDPDHARNAVRAALRCRERLAVLNETAAFQGHHLAHRIGLNSGEALVGNIGSRRRFNYTVMSDAVNLASRLEGANKYFGTSIMASEETVSRTGDAFAWRELDAIRVRGRTRPVRILEPIAEAGRVPPEAAARAAVYADGLARFRARDFSGAAEAFGRIAAGDPPAALFEKRARELAAAPPGPDWEPVFTLEGK
ncbi:adenylate/guanylate cyclase domain-containing protein [Rhodoplanes sp. TEM]|uniref:Adenylate/guanylate cyclase domain-containing protein n=1 Tax=Rhodoplanes tepidamans TaxID=200616 RepID=A0ABT5JES0_RHOTP|nr:MULTISPECIES: adenylate/guanylate cyclase domain-containing protein [Rhodoplanes]MDC7787565.1 adenylate/guanylate cyclase domain-containing protein [Rhodoplanes tepidamans]MDC7984942.1 adenylate/guanylate cyclase domain-containing protein [Rhodoplanes sp. TEM]MDQ0357994.1 class 3 adenylate cyclase/CHASE2 domain-containing sensor protein [Rhodoplanes tepidamans]